jgi:ABC-2 type transport system permease protein
MMRSGVRRNGFWTRLMALTRKEVRQLLRDRSNLATGIALPAVLILLFGYGISLDITHAPVAIVTEDASPTAMDVLSGLQRSSYLAPVFVRTMQEAEKLMSARTVYAILRVPSNFTAELSAGQGVLQLIVHGTDAASARVIQGYVAGAIARWSLGNAERVAGRRSSVDISAFGSVSVEERFWFNAANTSSWYLVPGLIVIIMTIVGAFLTSLVVARESVVQADSIFWRRHDRLCDVYAGFSVSV